MDDETPIGYGAGIFYADPADPDGTYTEVASVTEIDPNENEATDVDKTHLKSADAFREFRPGYANPGEISFKILFEKVRQASLEALFRVKKWWKVEVADAPTGTLSCWKCLGYIKAYKAMLPMDDKVETTVRIKLSGKPIFEQGTVVVTAREGEGLARAA